MALVDTQEVKLAISAETAGQAGVSALADQIEALAREGGAAAPQFAALAQQVRLLGQQTVSIGGLQTAIADAKGVWQAVQQARHEVQVLDKALLDAKGAGASAQAIRVLESELRAANRELTSSERAWARQKSTLAGARAESAALGVDVKNLGAAEQRLAVEVAATTAAVNAEIAAFAKAGQADKDRIAALRRQGSEEDRLADIVAANKARMAQAAKDQLAAEKRAYAESGAAAKRYAEQTQAAGAGINNAFSTLGIRSAKAIQSEIVAVNEALRKLTTSTRGSGAEFDRAWAAGQKRLVALKAELAGAKPAADTLTTSLTGVAAAVGGIFAASKLPGVAADLGRVADLYANIGARIDLVNSTQKGFNLTLDNTASLARATHTGLDTTANLLAALARAGSEVGISQGEVLRLTETINKANQLSGQSAQAADAAIVQLVQGLQSGVLRGEEFNSIMEQAPRLAKALADGLGVPIGALRAMAKEGKLTSDAVINALQSQSKAIDTEFGKLPLTIGRAMTDLTTNWTQFIGELDKTSGASAAVAKAIAGVGNNLETIGKIAAVAGEATLAAFAGKMIPQVAKFGQEAIAATKSVGGLRAGIAALPGTIKIGLAVVGFELLVEAGKYIGEAAAKASEAGATMRRATEEIRKANRAMLAMGQDLANANEQHRNAVALTAEEVMRLTDAERAAYQERLTGAKNYYLGAQRASMAAKELGVASEFSADQAAAGLRRAGEGLAAFEEGVRLSKAQLASLLSIDASLLIAQFDKIVASGKDVSEALKGVSSNFDARSVESVRGFGQALIELQETGKVSANQVGEAWNAALAKLDGAQLNGFAIAAQAAFGQSRRDVEALAAAMDGVLRASIAATGQDFSALTTGISSKAAAALGSVDVLADGFDRLKAIGGDASAALKGAIDFAIEAADSTKALDALTAKIRQLESEGKLAGGQVAAALEKIKGKSDELTAGINSVAEALKRLGITSDEELRKTARGAREAYEAVVKMGGSVREQEAAFRKYAEAAIAANNGVADATLQAQAAMHGLAIEADKAGKAMVVTMDEAAAKAAEAAAEAKKLSDALGGVEEAADRAGNRVAGIWSDEFTAPGAALDVAALAKKFGLDGNQLDEFASLFGKQLQVEMARSNPLNIEAMNDAAAQWAAGQVKNKNAPAPATRHEVRITLPDNSSKVVNMADSSSADVLADVFRQLEDGAWRS